MKTLMDNETEATFFLTYAGDIYTYSVEEEGTENYAIFLEGGEDAGRYSGTSQYAKLFLADGTEKEFAVSIKESDGTNTYTKAELNTNFQGKLVKYTVNTKDQVTDLEVAPEEYTSLAATEKFDDNGVYKNEALKSTTVVFSLVGTDVKSADSYKVIKAEDLFGAHADDIYYFVTSGNYDAALVKGATTVDKTYAIFIESAGTTKDGVLWTALYDGAVETLTVENTTALIAKVEGAAYTTAAGVAAKLAVLTMSDDVVTDIDASKVGAAGGTATGKSTLSGDVLTANSKKYSLDENVKVYVLDDGDWAAAAKSTLAMSASSYEKMFLINADDDAAIEFVLVIK